MGWSVGWAVPPEADLIDEILLAAGKALYLANRFEAKCSLVLTTANLTDLIKTDPVATLEHIASRLPADQMLGGTLRDLLTRTDMGVTPAVSAGLTRARLARNYIAHEGAAALGELYGYDVQHMLDALRVLRSNVGDLAEADNIVSRWVFSIEEPREPTPSINRSYPELVDDWIFGHMPAAWLDHNWRSDRKSPRTVVDAVARARSYEPFYSRVDRCLHDKAEAARRRREILKRSVAELDS
jgi:hypothetical protein